MKTPKTKMDLVRDTVRYMNEVAAMPLDGAEGYYVLCWPGEGSPLFVGMNGGEPFACGLQSAKRWGHMLRYPHVVNGRNEKAVPIPVHEAQLMALRSQADLVMTLCEPNSTLFTPAHVRLKPAKGSELDRANKALRATAK